MQINKNRCLATGAVCFFLALTAWFVRVGATHAQGNNSNPSNRPTYQNPWRPLEEKAKAAKSGDQGSIRALADQVFDQWNGFAQVPAELTDAVKDRLVRTEIDYRQGKREGVEERNIMDMTNAVAEKLGMPEYMKLNRREVRGMRLATLFFMPTFMGTGMTRKDMKVGDKINSSMSPLQAAELVTMVMQQKLINPEFQLTPADWTAREQENHLQRWQAYKQASASGGKSAMEQANKPSQADVSENPKRKEILDTIENARATMSLDDALQLANGALDTLGIER